MKVFRKKKELRKFLNDGVEDRSVGFVPTMGALHEGHLNLLKRAVTENHVVVCSIFVNPTQFNNPSDLEAYPRNIGSDKNKLEQAGCDALYYPQVADVYPDGARCEKFDLGELEKIMEGEYRPGHFQGVATVVKRFLEIVRPDKAYFGEKDYQQLMVIRKLVSDYNLSVSIVGCPIVREENGLAMSSRNERLTPVQRENAAIICQALQKVKKLRHERSLKEACKVAVDMINMQDEMEVEYFQIADAETLKPLQEWSGDEMIACVAAFCGDVRLIDNKKFK